MYKKLIVLMLLTSMLFLPSFSEAKDIPPGRWWRLPYFYEPLNLTDQQKSELDNLFDYNRNRLAELKKQLEQEKRDLTTMVEQEKLNEAAVLGTMKKLENTRTLLAATRFSYSLEVRKLLGHDRFQQLKSLYRNWQRNR
ncbi:MAG: hypothetical protein AAGU11_08340 [Syntrophobacteraceae bacterium]